MLWWGMVCLEVLTAVSPPAPRAVTIDDFTGKSSEDILRELVAMFRPMDAEERVKSRAAYDEMWRCVGATLRGYTVTGTCPNRSPDGAFDARQRAASQGRCEYYLGIPEREFGLAT